MVLALQRLAKWMEKSKSSQKDVGVYIGKTQAYVSMLLSGHITDVPDSVKRDISGATDNFVKLTDWFKEGVQ